MVPKWAVLPTIGKMMWFALRHPGKGNVILINRASRKVKVVLVDEVPPDLLEAYRSAR